MTLSLHYFTIDLIALSVVLDERSIYEAAAFEPKLHRLTGISSPHYDCVCLTIRQPSVEERSVRADQLVNLVIL